MAVRRQSLTRFECSVTALVYVNNVAGVFLENHEG